MNSFRFSRSVATSYNETSTLLLFNEFIWWDLSPVSMDVTLFKVPLQRVRDLKLWNRLHSGSNPFTFHSAVSYNVLFLLWISELLTGNMVRWWTMTDWFTVHMLRKNIDWLLGNVETASLNKLFAHTWFRTGKRTLLEIFTINFTTQRIHKSGLTILFNDNDSTPTSAQTYHKNSPSFRKGSKQNIATVYFSITCQDFTTLI